MKIYIAGPITGVPDYRARFAAAERKLRAEGHSVMNPAVLPEGFEQDEYMHVCFAMMECCEAVYFLPGWEGSAGAYEERIFADEMGLAILGEKQKRP